VEPLERFLRALEARGSKVRRMRDRARATCPSHKDRKPSLAIQWTGEKVLFRCHAGCTQTDVLQALGLSWPELFTAAPRAAPKKRITAIYPYRDETGTVLAQKVRFVPKAFLWRIPEPGQPERFRWGLSGVLSLPMYRRNEIESASEVIIVEGEKGVDRLWDLGFVATCAPSGAASWPCRFTEELGRLGVTSVVVLPDADVPGKRHADRVAKSVLEYSQGGTMSAKIIALSGLPPGGDVVDWLDAGGTPEELRRRIRAAPIWFPGQAERERMERRRKSNADRQKRFRARRREERLIATA
jgi:DNA primase